MNVPFEQAMKHFQHLSLKAMLSQPLSNQQMAFVSFTKTQVSNLHQDRVTKDIYEQQIVQMHQALLT